jgi:predicted component of type VI protein secretion system
MSYPHTAKDLKTPTCSHFRSVTRTPPVPGIRSSVPSRERWYEYSRVRDLMLEATDTEFAPWHILRSDDKKRARLNCIAHLLSLIPYREAPRPDIKLPKRSKKEAYDDEAILNGRRFVPEKY